MGTHVIVGAGAVGTGLAEVLAAAGHHVRVITRSGTGPARDGVERIAGDARDTRALAAVVRDADAVYNCANPRYHRWATDWPPLAASLLDVAEETGATLVTMSNLYGHRPAAAPMRESDPLDPPSRKGAIRATMWRDALERHEAGRIRATEARASDFIGPGLGDAAHMGDRVVRRVLAGRPVSVVGDPDVPHSWTAIGDVARTLAILGTDDRALGRPWNVPTAEPMSARALIGAMAREAALDPPTVRRIPPAALRVAGWFSPDIRELREIRYQFEQPFILDSADITATFGIEATPISETVRATVASYRAPASIEG